MNDTEVISTLNQYFKDTSNKVTCDSSVDGQRFRGFVCFVLADFTCPNMYEDYYGWTECGKCKCLYNCNVSGEFKKLLNNMECQFDWADCAVGVVTRKGT